MCILFARRKILVMVRQISCSPRKIGCAAPFLTWGFVCSNSGSELPEQSTVGRTTITMATTANEAMTTDHADERGKITNKWREKVATVLGGGGISVH